MYENDLQPNVDYIYCDRCKIHVRCIPLEPGVWQIECPGCVGECSMCSCHLASHCFGKGGVPIQLRIKVVSAGGKT